MKQLLSLAEKDKRYLWHPFTQMREWVGEEPLIVARGQGVRLEDIHGRQYYDGVSSLWLNVHGHRRPELDEALRVQLEKIAHSTMLGLSNVPAIELAEALVELVPAGLTRVFYSDSGSEAMEIALKMAFQYWQYRGERERTLFVTLQNAYHGDTVGAVSVGGIPLFHGLFRPLLFPTVAAPSPYCYRCPLGRQRATCGLACAAALEELLAREKHRAAAVVVESGMQGAGGIIVHPEGYLARVAEACRRHGVLLVLDEVATGFGRSGEMFACQREGVQPDLLAVAKGLTGGYLPLAATLAREEIYQAFLGLPEEHKTFYHGHSYTGNPLACAVALANLELLRRPAFLAEVREKAAFLAERLAGQRRLDGVGDVRQLGMIAGVELVDDSASGQPFPPAWRLGVETCRECRPRGMILRPLDDVVVFMPPLASTRAELSEMLDILAEAIQAAVAGARRRQGR